MPCGLSLSGLSEWYNLVRIWLYVVCEANIESHGMGYGERTLAKDRLMPRLTSKESADGGDF